MARLWWVRGLLLSVACLSFSFLQPSPFSVTSVHALANRPQVTETGASFVQGYASGSLSDQPMLSIFGPASQLDVQLDTNAAQNGVVVVAMPNGDYLATWTRPGTSTSMAFINDVFYAIVSPDGTVKRAATRVTDNAAATHQTQDYKVATAATPDGTIALIWVHLEIVNFTQTSVVQYAIMDAAGNMASHGTLQPNTGMADNPIVMAASANRYLFAWGRFNSSNYEVYYTVLQSNGTVIKASTSWRTGGCSNVAQTYVPQPALAALADKSTLVVDDSCNQIAYGRLSSSGAVSSTRQVLTSDTQPLRNNHPAAVQLFGGNIVVAWTYTGTVSPPSASAIRYVVLSPTLGLVKDKTTLPVIYTYGHQYPSVTSDWNKAILSFADGMPGYTVGYSYIRYAVLDSSGAILTSTSTLLADALSFTLNSQGVTHIPPLRTFVPAILR